MDMQDIWSGVQQTLTYNTRLFFANIIGQNYNCVSTEQEPENVSLTKSIREKPK